MCFLLPTLLLLKPERVFDYLPAPTSTRARLNTTRSTYQWGQVIRLVVGHATSTFQHWLRQAEQAHEQQSQHTQQAGKPSKKQRRAAASSEALAGCCRRMIDDADDVT